MPLYHTHVQPTSLAEAALFYAQTLHWPVLPLRRQDKTPATAHGCKDASCDAARVRAWWHETPHANVGVATGDILVLDFDMHKADFAGGELLDMLLDEYPTPTADTPRGGVHLFFAQRPGMRLTNARGALPAGIDVRGAGGYVAVAPSVFAWEGGTGVYRWRTGRAPGAVSLAPVPFFIVDLITAEERSRQAGAQHASQNDAQHDDVIAEFNRTHKIADLLTAHGYQLARSGGGVARLRRPNGHSLSVAILTTGGVERSYHHSTGDALYTDRHARDAFDVWTKLEHGGDAAQAYQSAKRAQGKWRAQGAARVRTPAVEQNGDSGHETGDMLISDRIDRDLREWGYRLWLNDMDESVWNGEERMNDADRAVLRMTARDAGYAQAKLMSALDDAIVALATRRRRHPVRDYLAGLSWDGSDHIAHLASYFDDRHEPIAYSDGTRRTVFHAFLRRWLVSSIAKMHNDESAARSNFVLVLAGEQNAGKSHFAGWLCPLPGYFVEKHIAPEDRDCSLQRARAWVWEVMELGATTGRANVEALKGHITATHVTERKAYGHFDTVRPAVASYIGTVNPDGGGFLADQTGNRRFAVVDVDHINWQYSERIDVAQVWAQAMHIWRTDPQAYRFSAEERAVQAGNADAHMAPDVFADMLVRTYQIDPAQTTWRASSSEILDALRTYAGLSRGSDKMQGKDLARTLKKEWGLIGKRSNGATIYVGLMSKINHQAGA